MKQKPIIQWMWQDGGTNHKHQTLMAGMLLAGMLILAGLAVPQIGMAEETTEAILTKLATPIKDIANMQKLEGTTFHAINITEHDSVLPAELRLAGKESDWADGVVGYVDGKEVLTGLIPAGDHIRLMVCVPLKPREAKKITFKKGKSAAATDLKVEQTGNRVVVSNGQARWELGPNGLEQFQRSGKTFGLKETGIANGTLKATMTPAVCRVVLSAEGVPSREYLFYPNSSLWQVNADRNYRLIVSGTNAFYYSHPCTTFFGDPGSPYGAVIETGELEKGGGGINGLKEFHLFSGADWGMLIDKGIGLGIYPTPSAHTILVDTTKRPQGVVVQAVPIDERSNAIFKKWHWGMEVERMCGCGWWRTQKKTLADPVSYVFGATADVKEGLVQRSAALIPVLLRSLGNQLHGAQLPWITANRSETIRVDDLDGNGPDMLNDRWHWCDNGKPMSSFEFNDTNKDGRLDDIYIYAKWDDKGGALDAMESKYPVLALHDQTRDGKITANCVFFGGRIDQDWFEYNPGDREMKERKKPVRTAFGWENVKVPPLEAKKYYHVCRVLDLDGDGDWDIADKRCTIEESDTDYNNREGWYVDSLDCYDNNPFNGLLLEPFTGSLAIIPGGCRLGISCLATFRYKGVPVAGMDAVCGNMCLDGDGLPEIKPQFNAGLYDDYFVFQPSSVMVGSSMFLENRHALGKINHWNLQEGGGSTSCYKTDLGLFPIRKNSGFNWLKSSQLDCSRMMPKRKVEDSITTYRDKWGNEIRFVGLMQPAKWDGRLVAGSRDAGTAKDWRDAFHYDWDYLLVTFEGYFGCAGESGYPTHYPRWEFCPDYAQRRQAKVFYSELDGRLHLTGATWGHYSPYLGAKSKIPLDRFGREAIRWLHEGYFCLDCDTMRCYASRHEPYFDEDGDGYVDCFLTDANNDGWYEERAWYDKASRTVWCMKDGILVLWPYKMEPYPEEELLLDRYDKLVALKRMSMEKKSFMKATSIKTTPLSISVPESNLWLSVNGELLPQVLLDITHCETNIWSDLSPKGYSRLLTGLHRQKAIVRELNEKWSEESLRNATALFVVPPYTTKPDADELKALDSFLKNGGRVVMAFPDWSVEPTEEAYALRADKPLVPDGKIGEWAGPQGIDIVMKWDTRPKGYDVKIRVCPKWDQANFYLYAEVHDRDLINKQTGGDIWMDDCIQFALSDPGVKWDWFGCPANTDIRMNVLRAKGMKWQEYGIARTDKGPQVYRWIDVLGNRTGPVAGAKVEVIRQGDKTVYQLALPWAEVGQTDVKAGTELALSLVVWDRASEREIRSVNWGGGIAQDKDPVHFRKLILLDTPDAANTYAGTRVDSPLDALCASYGIRRNNERVALAPAIDPHFRQRELGPEVSARFNGDRSEGLMKGVRKLFFNGSSLDAGGLAAPLIQYREKVIAAKARVGKGELLVLCSEMMLNNYYACFHSFEGGGCNMNEHPFDKLIDVKPDNNVFLDNLARCLVADQQKFKVVKVSNKQMTVELSVAGKVYVNKETEVALGSKEATSGKESGDTLCFEVPVSKDPIKLKISR